MLHSGPQTMQNCKVNSFHLGNSDSYVRGVSQTYSQLAYPYC